MCGIGPSHRVGGRVSPRGTALGQVAVVPARSSGTRLAYRSASSPLETAGSATFALCHTGTSGSVSWTSTRIASHTTALTIEDSGAVRGAPGGQLASPGGTCVSTTTSLISYSRCPALGGACAEAVREVTATTLAPAARASWAASTG